MLLCVALACVTLPNHSSALLTALSFQEQEKSQAPRNGRLREELLRMRDDDQAARQRWTDAKFGELASREMIAVDEKHTARLRAIFKEHGFPGVSLVGKDGASAAHTLLLHTPSLDLKKEGLVYLEEMAKKGEVPMHAVAGLKDKVLVAEGKPQFYGMSFDLIDGKLVLDLKNVVDPARLEKRRAEAGLPPLAEYAKGLEELYKVPAVVLNEQLLKP
jgi:hypothetical protein